MHMHMQRTAGGLHDSLLLHDDRAMSEHCIPKP